MNISRSSPSGQAAEICFTSVSYTHLDVYKRQGVYGNKSLGEPPLISPAPALRNAVLDATGVAVNAIPMTPKLLFEEFVKAGLVKG